MTSELFVYRFRIALHDTDAAGVLFFSNLFRHAHDAYEVWMETRGFPLDAMIRDRGLALPLVRAEADYRRPMRHGDRIGVLLDIAELGKRSFSIDYRFETEDRQEAATARTVHACVLAAEGGRARPLPEALAQALAQVAHTRVAG